MVHKIRHRRLQAYKDLDQRTIAPIAKINVGGAWVPFPIDWKYTVLMPYEYVRNVLDGDLRVIAVKSNDRTAVSDVAFRLMRGSWGELEVFSGFDGHVGQYMSSLILEVTGLQLLPVPLAIAIMVIFLTMLGNIHERSKEISVYSSVGLSPLHVIGMFLSESVTYALVGGVIGYLSGLVGIALFLYMGVIPPALNVNLSSSTVFLTLGVSAVATLLAALYPVFIAGRLVTPSLERKWKIRTKPVGNEWSIPLPFNTTTEEEAKGVLAYISEYLDLYTSSEIGQFWVKEPAQFKEEHIPEEERRILAISTIVALPPWDLGFTEEMRLFAAQTNGKYEFHIYLKCLGRPEERPWLRGNPVFIDAVRKQLLLWKGLIREEKEKYVKEWDKK